MFLYWVMAMVGKRVPTQYNHCQVMNKTIYFHDFHRILSYISDASAMSTLDIDTMRALTAIAESGGITRAAKRLNLSQSALSVQIRKLEARLGQDLFERRGRQLHLTEAGRIALDHADAIFRVGDELLGTLKETGRVRRPVRVGALATLSRNFQMSFLEPILGRPDVEMILRSGSQAELLRGLEALSLDVLLVHQPPPRDAITAFVAHRLAEQPVSLVGTPEALGDGAEVAEVVVVELAHNVRSYRTIESKQCIF